MESFTTKMFTAVYICLISCWLVGICEKTFTFMTGSLHSCRLVNKGQMNSNEYIKVNLSTVALAQKQQIAGVKSCDYNRPSVLNQIMSVEPVTSHLCSLPLISLSFLHESPQLFESSQRGSPLQTSCALSLQSPLSLWHVTEHKGYKSSDG